MNAYVSEISHKVLFVDDESLLLEGVKRQLRREFDISTAQGGEQALEIVLNSGPFAIVVSDYNMPKMDGISFLNQVFQHCPDTVLMMLTGRAELEIAVNALHSAHISRFLNKPCPKEVLVESLNDGLEQYRLRKTEQILQLKVQEANQQLHLLNTQLEFLVTEKTKALQLQYQYAAELARIDNCETIIYTYIDAVKQLTGTEKITLWLNPRQDGEYICNYPTAQEHKKFNQESIFPSVIHQCLSSKTSWFKDESPQIPSKLDYSFFDGQPYICQILHGEQGLVGLLNLADCNIQLDNGIRQSLTAMADVTATALQSIWHRAAFGDAQDAIITALAKLSEYRDPETGSHLLRLKKYASLICQFLAETKKYREIVTPEYSQDLVRSSPLHDIGKVGIPDAILKKPGKLTADEFEIMKTHATIGGDTLRSVYEQYPSQGFIKCGMEIAYCHHEKWNGSGYPNGLKGEAIPLSARILALVDVYDALTCRRVYKQPFSREQAKNLIVEGAGSHFDPDLVNAFLSLEVEFYDIAENFADRD
jgi:response regulator RpfG family c-di-GMP phosphodiesterase